MNKVRHTSKGKLNPQDKHPLNPDFLNALVVASYGRHFLAHDDTGAVWQVFGKGKRREVAVGDEIVILPSGDMQAWIENILPRKNLVYRSDALKSKLFAANLDRVLLMLAINPPYSPELLGRTLIACNEASVPLTILFNKIDILGQDEKKLNAIKQDLNEITLGEVTIHFLSIKENPKQTEALLRPLLVGKRTLILGQSGMGKSTLINLLIPGALAATNEISIALNAGKHTTTHTQLHFGENGLELIDSPGFQAFGLNHLSQNDLLNAFPDLYNAGLKCRFANCQHKHEPDCAVKIGLEEKTLSPARYSLYQMLLAELNHARQNY
jgi:ribosome biogenesis GTPase